MNQTTYKSICSVQVFHSYFEDTLMRAIEFTPTGHFKEIIGQLGIVLRLTENGFQLFSPTEETITSFLAQLSNTHGITAFDFDITINDPKFYNYTDLPIGRIVSFSSADPQNETIGDQTVLHPSLHEREDTNLLGNLHIAIDDILSLASNDAPITFAISFSARATQWCYYIINDSLLPVDNLHIVSDADIQFSDPIEVVMPNEAKALLMTSNVLIPLSNSRKYDFELKFDETTIPLPIAGSDRIYMVERDGAQWAVSKLYIYI